MAASEPHGPTRWSGSCGAGSAGARCGPRPGPTATTRRGRRYACRSSDNLGGCGGIQIKAEFVEDAVRDYIIGVLSDPELRDELLAAAPAPDDRDHTAVMAELRQADTARQRLTDLAVDGVITAAEVRRKTTELDARVDQLQRQLADLPSRAVVNLPVTEEDLLTAWEERDIDFQRSLIGLLIDTITVGPATRMGPGRFDASRLTWALRF
jgi:hypothetical protein